ARLAVEELGYRRGRFEHRPDEAAHHVAEVAVGGDLEVEVVVAPSPLRSLDVPNEDLVLRLRGREGAEIVLTDDRGGGCGERGLVEGPRHPPAAARLERRGRRAREEPVAVAARPRRVTRVKVVRGHGCRDDRDL